ncbi:MAG: hypothetical protein ABF269_05030 [Candidatus Arcticimaribacter sp.]
MLRKLLSVFALLATVFIHAQNSSASPYSLGGLGDITFRGNAIDRMMGGLSVYSDSIHANLNNPASLGELKLTTFSVGVHYKNTQLSSLEANDKVASGSLDYIAVSIPTKHFGFSFGVMPYSSVGYRLQSIDDAIEGSTVINQYEGGGGVNKTFFAVGVNLFKGFNLGATVNYNFGNINTRASRLEENIDFGTYLLGDSAISGFDYNLSAHGKFALTNKIVLDAFGSFSPEHSLVSKNEQTYYTQSISTQNVGAVQEVDLSSSGLDELSLTIGNRMSYGLSVGQDKKWLFGAQITVINSGNYRNDFIQLNNISYEDSSRLSVGGMYIPNYASITSYWKRIAYRAGFRQEASGVIVNSVPLEETGMSFGVSLPLGGFYSATNVSGYSNLNVGLELGQRGVDTGGLVKENFWAVRVGLSLNDLWFIKRKYN